MEILLNFGGFFFLSLFFPPFSWLGFENCLLREKREGEIRRVKWWIKTAKAKMFLVLFWNVWTASTAFMRVGMFLVFLRNVSTHYEATNFHSLKRVVLSPHFSNIFKKGNIVNARASKLKILSHVSTCFSFYFAIYNIKVLATCNSFLQRRLNVNSFFKRVSRVEKFLHREKYLNSGCVWNRVIKQTSRDSCC